MIRDAMFEECAHACHECQDMCLRTIVHCLDMGGEHASREHQTLLHDCAGVCGLSHSFLHRRSPWSATLCRACADICDVCADECEHLGRGDPMMEACARACGRCARSCEEMTGVRL